MTSKVALFLALPALASSQAALTSWTHNSDPGSGMTARDIAFLKTDAVREAIAAVHTIVKTQKISSDPANQSVTVEGNAREVDLAEWLLGELGKQPDSSGHGYIMPHDSDDVTLVIGEVKLGAPISAGPARVAAPPDLKEIAEAVHVLADIPRAAVYAPTSVLVWRGKVWQNDFVLWLLQELATPPTVNWTAPISHLLEQPSRNVRIFYFEPETTVHDLGQIVNTVRQKGRAQRVFAIDAERAIVLRGTDIEAAAAGQVIAAARH